MGELRRIGEVLADPRVAGIFRGHGIFLDSTSFDTEEERLEAVHQIDVRSAARYNESDGRLNVEDGYDCPKCRNRGDFQEAERPEDGSPRIFFRRCECMNARESIRRMKASGLERLIGSYTMARFEATEPWQKGIKDLATAYCRDDTGAWWYIGGAVGSGKTHICTAICRWLLGNGARVYYSLWTEESGKLKAQKYDDPDEYARRMERLKCCDVLYIDDLFKPTPGRSPGKDQPSDADVLLAYDLLNHRYINRKRTIISSERYLPEIVDIDEAVGSRIAEMAKGYVSKVGRGTGKNQRMMGVEG